MMRFGWSERGGGGAAAYELASVGPASDELVAGGIVIAYEGDVVDLDGEQPEPARYQTKITPTGPRTVTSPAI
jgi:hypothetical protein